MKTLQFFLYLENGVTVLVVLIVNIESFSKDHFHPGRLSEGLHRRRTSKTPKELYKSEDDQYCTLKLLIPVFKNITS